MTRYTKIKKLVAKGLHIVCHFGQYTSQRRLIIDEVEEFKYNKTAEDQKLAGEYVDLLYWENFKDEE